MKNYHHAHVKDAVTSTAVMSLTISCTELIMKSTLQWLEVASVPTWNSTMNGMMTSTTGGTELHEKSIFMVKDYNLDY